MAKVLIPSRPQDNHKTFVKFLIHPTNGELIAYFPYMKYGFNGYRHDLKTCYAHVGQHSSCAPEYAKECRYAKETEYSDLKKELESLGYNLKLSVNNLK
jgi:hypothetical protein